MSGMLEELGALLAQGCAVALSRAVERSGSAPTPAGAYLLVTDRKVLGTLGGGPVEAEVLRRSRAVLGSGVDCLSEFSFDSAVPGPDSMLCGGRVTFHTCRVQPTELSRRFWEAALVAGDCGEGGWLVSAVYDRAAAPEGAAHLLVTAGQVSAGRLPDAAWETVLLAALDQHGNERDTLYLTPPAPPAGYAALAGFLAQPLRPPARLLICGGGHIGRALCRVAALAGFRVTVADDRPEYAAPERFPEAERVLCAPLAQAFDSLAPGAGWQVVAVNRSHDQDRETVELALGRPVDYVGMIGSRRKIKLLWEQLAARGVDPAALETVQAPVGLAIGAETPEEIAVSIAAQLIQVRRGGGRPQLRRQEIRLV